MQLKHVFIRNGYILSNMYQLDQYYYGIDTYLSYLNTLLIHLFVSHSYSTKLQYPTST